MEEKQVLVKGINTNYKVFGQTGSAMLILHGWGSKSERWTKLAELLAEKDVLVIVPDLPGFGLTQEPKEPWNLDNYIEWVNEFSEKIPELNKPFYLLGHSFGGSLAVKFSIKYNQKVEKLFLVSAACLRKPSLSKRIWYRISKIVKVFSFLPYYQLFRKAFYKFIIRKSDYPYVKEGIMKATYIKTLREDLSQRLSFIRIPTIIIWGSKDTLTPISDAYVINKKIHNSKLIVVDGANHSLQVETPEVLVQKISGEIASQSIPGEVLS